MANFLNEGVVGQVDPGHFVERLYQEQNVRFRLVSVTENDRVVATAVDFRFITGPGVADFVSKAEVFGITSNERSKATAMFQAWVANMMVRGELPQ